MSSEVILKVENLGKQYRLGLVGTGTISHDINRWWSRVRGKDDPYLKVGETNVRSEKGDSQYVWAIKNINFEVKRGEVLGIIGKNGAGKSTLLKILSKVTSPTVGIVKTNGRIASLLEVGTGFHPEMTGRENIYLNGAILGMTKAEINDKIDEIIEFSGCLRYIDTPVKRYSSGMRVRLAFAVAAFLEPDILVVDEVLAVGDAEFQKKAIGKMQDISSSDGRTVLFVSHNMESMARLCERGILLNHGEIEFTGKINDVIDYYLSNNLEFRSTFTETDLDENCYVQRVSLKNSKGESTSNFRFNEDISVEFDIIKNEGVLDDFDLSFAVVNSSNVVILSSSFSDSNSFSIEEGETTFKAKINGNFLNKGDYKIRLFFYNNTKRQGVQRIDCLNFKINEIGFYNNAQVRRALIIPNLDWVKE
ncbi:ABC transporter ATP-binding protein [Winogradskyella tangerina]|uniref:ABC transporter ATP-binding protein n=1 Tax=Winogradskyella tangerina TaxID=2023240 RepID=UPI000DBE0EF0|nr:polysaccharide ABC transporter ATP-binding protein [Winogradskyella tangerina]